jgi:lipid A disaccharide synthetase
MSNIFIIAGDSSGDIYAADLIQRMKAKNDIISFEGNMEKNYSTFKQKKTRPVGVN